MGTQGVKPWHGDSLFCLVAELLQCEKYRRVLQLDVVAIVEKICRVRTVDSFPIDIHILSLVEEHLRGYSGDSVY